MSKTDSRPAVGTDPADVSLPIRDSGTHGDRYQVAKGTPSLGGFVVWDWAQQTYVADDHGVALRLATLGEADRVAEQMNQAEVEGAQPDLVRQQSEQQHQVGRGRRVVDKTITYRTARGDGRVRTRAARRRRAGVVPLVGAAPMSGSDFPSITSGGVIFVAVALALVVVIGAVVAWWSGRGGDDRG